MSERESIEILYTAGFNKNFIELFLNRDRSTVGRELDKNKKEYWDMKSTKSPYKHKGQENVKYYSLHKRESNENKNRLIRRSFKKRKLVEKLTDEDILSIARKINNMPRKALGYRTPLEVFEENLKKKKISTKFLDKYRVELPKCLIA